MGRFLDRVARTVPSWIQDFVRFQSELGERIRRRIQELEQTQAEFAKQGGMHSSQLSKIVAGNANLTLRSIFKLQAQLGVRLIDLTPLKTGAQPLVPFMAVRYQRAQDTPVMPCHEVPVQTIIPLTRVANTASLCSAEDFEQVANG